MDTVRAGERPSGSSRPIPSSTTAMKLGPKNHDKDGLLGFRVQGVMEIGPNNHSKDGHLGIFGDLFPKW